MPSRCVSRAANPALSHTVAQNDAHPPQLKAGDPFSPGTGHPAFSPLLQPGSGVGWTGREMPSAGRGVGGAVALSLRSFLQAKGSRTGPTKAAERRVPELPVGERGWGFRGAAAKALCTEGMAWARVPAKPCRMVTEGTLGWARVAFKSSRVVLDEVP